MAQGTSLGGLISGAIRDGKALLDAHVALTRAEVRQAGQDIVVVSIFAVVALLAIATAALFALITVALGLMAAGIPAWASFLIVTGFLVIVAVVTAIAARWRSRGVTRLEASRSAWRATKEAVTQGKKPEPPSI